MPFTLHHAAALGADIRPATGADQPFLSALYRSTREDEMEAAAMPEATRALFALQQFAAQQRDYAARFPLLDRWIVEAGSAPVGRLWLAALNDEVRIVDISLLPDARGRGLGTALLRDTIDWADSLKKPLRLSVFILNPAQSLYARMGFLRRSATDSHIEMEHRPKRR